MDYAISLYHAASADWAVSGKGSTEVIGALATSMDCIASLSSIAGTGWAVSGEGSAVVPSGIAFTTDNGGCATRLNFVASLNHTIGDFSELAVPESPQLECVVVGVLNSHSTQVMWAEAN